MRRMIVEVFDCDLCGCKMKEPWTEFYTHADKYWCSRASVHFCKDCSDELFNQIFKRMNEVKIKDEEK